MTIALNGEVVHSCDTDTDFQTLNSGVNISGDDDIVEGAGAAGDKISAGTDECVVDAFEGATTTFDFSSGGTHEGWHGIGWINTKTPINATTGIQAYARNNAGHNGYINAMPSYFYKGGFTTRVWNPTADFTAASTWTTNGNPAQLDDVTGFGFRFTTTTSIMGSFNNVQVDQFTFGLGVRADVGTSGTPNTYQDVVDQDQDTSFWGWFSSLGAKGGLYLGPATGTTASWFVDSGFAIKFVDENVDTGFYGIFARGANTTMTFTLANISAENPTNARWSLIIDSALGDTTGGFTDTNGVWSGVDIITLNGNSTLTGTTIIDAGTMTQNGATLDAISIINPNVTTDERAIIIDAMDDLFDSTFEGTTTGHAVEYIPVGAGPFDVDWSGITSSGYAATDGSTGDETILIHPDTNSANITLNVINGSTTPTIMEHADYTGTFTLVISPVSATVSVTDELGAPLVNARVFLEASDDTGDSPFEDTVTITHVTTTATVSHTGHGVLDGKKVVIRGANETEYNGVFIITVVDVNSYTYVMNSDPGGNATGTILCSGVILEGLTDSSGEIVDTRSLTINQPMVGWARKSTNSPYYKNFPISGDFDSASGFLANVMLTRDD